MPPTSLLGREQELGQVLDLLDRDDVRLVTLLGPGGVGKTRLALEVARALHPVFADGATFVPLESVRHPDLLPGSIARVLRIREAPGVEMSDLVAEVIADRHQLLVLDNVEQIVDAAPWLSILLASCPRLKVLVTSRIPLTIGGEQQVALAPLPVPNGASNRTAAVELFLERARFVNADLDADAPTIATVAEICRRLDGLPLAIELAAARMRVLSINALHGRLTHRLDVLTGGRRDVPPRLRSMRDAIDWSYELLSVEQQRLFRRVSVFLGSFTLDAAAFIAAWPDPRGDEHDTLDRIESLVDQSLMRMVKDTVEPRYAMLETIREYGLDAARRLGEDDLVDMAHAEYYLSTAHHCERALHGPEQVALLERLEQDYPNVLAAIDWLEHHGRLEDAISLVGGIQFFVNVRGHSVEFIERLERWLGNPALGSTGRARGVAMLVLGGLLQNTGPLERSMEALRESVDLFHLAGDQWNEAQAQGRLGATYGMMGKFDRMREWATSALDLARPIGHHRIISTCLDFLSWHASVTGDLNLARKLQEEGAQVAVENGDIWVQAFHMGARAHHALAEHRIDEAETLALKSLRHFEAVDSRRDLPGAWSELATIAFARGDYDTAADRVERGISIAQAARYKGTIDHSLLLQAVIAVARGDFVSAREALAGVQQDLEPVVTPLYLEAFALLMARSGDNTQAVRTLQAANQLGRSVAIDTRYQVPDSVVDSWRRSALRTELGDEVLDRIMSETAPIDVGPVIAEAQAWQLAEKEHIQPEPETTHGLSPRELEVLHLIAAGMSNQQIADELYVSHRTVTSHVTGILGKLGMPSRTAAVSFAIRQGIA